MAGRTVVPIGMNKKHFTNSEKEARICAEKRLKGNNDHVKPPTWLDKAAKKEFRHLAQELKLLDIVTNIDVGGLAIICDAYSKYIMATSVINSTTIDAQITKANNGATIKRHPISAVEKYATIYRQYCAEYGLMPAARIKLSTNFKPEDEADENVAMFG